jgi:chromate transporter
MLLCTRSLDRIKGSPSVNAVLRGIRSGVVGMIMAAVFVIAGTAEPRAASLVIFGASLFALLRYKVETAWVIPAAGIAGLLAY